MHWYAVDLHIHSALSACAGDDMTPPAMAAALAGASINIAALTDHNSSGNSAAFGCACAAQGLTALYGMELETSEEVHLLCLFGELEQALLWQETVRHRLPDLASGRGFGRQVLYDCHGHEIGTEPRLLSVASSLSLDEAIEGVRTRQGICIAAHINRPVYGLLGVLGMVPHGIRTAALEMTQRARVAEMRQRPDLGGHTLVSFSDAHHLEQIQPARTAMLMAEPTFSELRLALAGADGRRTVVLD